MASETAKVEHNVQLTEDDILHMKEVVGIIIDMMKRALAQRGHVEELSFHPTFAFELDVLFTLLSERNEHEFELDRVCQYGAFVADSLRYVHQRFAITGRVESFDIRFSAFIIFVAAVSSLFMTELRKGLICISDEDTRRFRLCVQDVAAMAMRPCPTVTTLLDEFDPSSLVRVNVPETTLH